MTSQSWVKDIFSKKFLYECLTHPKNEDSFNYSTKIVDRVWSNKNLMTCQSWVKDITHIKTYLLNDMVQPFFWEVFELLNQKWKPKIWKKITVEYIFYCEIFSKAAFLFHIYNSNLKINKTVQLTQLVFKNK